MQEEDAVYMAIELGGIVPIKHNNSGEYPHYHVNRFILFEEYKHFHLWYGELN